jgi:acyl dehydratase
MITYDSFTPGQVMGTREMVLDAAALEAWRELFPQDDLGGAMPHGMAAAISMRAYAEILQPRPPGNVHAAQHFELLRLPRQGERLTTAISCLEKERRKGRSWVTLGMETTGPEGPAFRGRMAVIWAA